MKQNKNKKLTKEYRKFLKRHKQPIWDFASGSFKKDINLSKKKRGII